MKTSFPKAVPFLLLPALVASLPHAATATPVKKPGMPAAKSASRPAAKQPKLIKEVLGTDALQGYEGALGETFTLGKDTPFNFALKSVEYSVGRVNIGDTAFFPKGDEKLLVLHFSIQNPQPRTLNFTASSLILKAVDANGVTRDYVGNIAREGTGEVLNIPLNPTQKVDAVTVIPVAAYGEVPKLLVQNWYERQAPIIRYDLRGKVKILAAPFADPADAKGATAPRSVPAKAGTFYPVTDIFDARLESVSYTTDPIQNVAPGAGKRYCVATFTLKNMSRKAARPTASYFRADLKDADGEKTDYNASMLKGSRDEEAGSELQPGEEAKVRFYWALPEKVEAKTVLLQYGYNRESRTYAFDVAK